MYFLEDVKDYVGFTDEDADRLAQLKPSLEPHFVRVVDSFYESLQQHEHAREIFEGPEQIERLRGLLREWLDELFTGPHDRDYWESRREIGRVHVEHGVKPKYFVGAMNLIRVELVDLLHTVSHDVPIRRAQASIQRILDLDLMVISTTFWESLMDQKTQTASALARGLAHEIGNPLNSVRLNLTLLERRLAEIDAVDEEEVVTPVLDSVRRELDRVDALTNDIQDFANPLELDRDWYDAAAFAEELRALHGPTLEATGIDFEIDVDDSPLLYCDVDRLKQAVLNLLQNAAEAIESEGTIHVRIEETASGQRVLVEDDGRGLEPSETERIFDLFHTSKPTGTGIGLPLVKKIVDAHDGSIDVRTRPGEGSTFHIELPNPESSKRRKT